MSRRARRILLAILVAVALPATLAACYLPDEFIAEIRINRAGGYAFTYRGALTWVPLYRDVEMGKLTAEEAEEKAEAFRRDLVRDPAFKKVEHVGKGRFEVDYERQGVLPLSRQVSFVRRNADIIAFIARPDGSITIRANAMSARNAQQAMELGLQVRGKFHVVTDAQVLHHNAEEVRSYRGYDVYVWTIENVLSPSPRLVMQREEPAG